MRRGEYEEDYHSTSAIRTANEQGSKLNNSSLLIGGVACPLGFGERVSALAAASPSRPSRLSLARGSCHTALTVDHHATVLTRPLSGPLDRIGPK